MSGYEKHVIYANAHLLFMENCGSLNLHSFIARKLSHKNRVQLILKVFSQICIALSLMHHQNFVHNDVKPENIVIDARDNKMYVTLVDFGSAVNMSADCQYSDELGHYVQTS